MELSDVRYFHCRPLEYSPYDVVYQHPETDPDMRDFELAYQWLEKQIGYYGIFMAAGEQSLPITCYDWQFRRAVPSERHRNDIMVGYKELPEVRFSDYDNWHLVLNAVIGAYTRPEEMRMGEVSDYVRRLVLKPSWRQSDWFRAVRQGRVYAQAHVPALDLRQADVIWCRNTPAKKELIRRGFDEEQVTVKRVKVDGW